MALLMPLISPKAYSKIQYVASLSALYNQCGVSLAGLNVTPKTLQVESQSLQQQMSRSSSRIKRPDESTGLMDNGQAPPHSIDDLFTPTPKRLPPLLRDLRSVILSPKSVTTEGLFRKSSNVGL